MKNTLIITILYLSFLGTGIAENSLNQKIINSLVSPELASTIHPEATDKILANPKVHKALDILKPFDTARFSLDQLIHHTNQKIANAATFIRQYFLYFRNSPGG